MVMSQKERFLENLEQAKRFLREVHSGIEFDERGRVKADPETLKRLAGELRERGFWVSVVSKLTGLPGFKQPKPKRAERDMERTGRMEKARIRRDQPLITREIEDQAWFKNNCYEVGKYVLVKLWRHTDLEPDDLSLENWERCRDKILNVFDEAYKFWLEKPDVRALQDDLRVMELDRDMYLEAARKFMVALKQTSTLLQTALVLMPKEKLEKLAALISMADLSHLEPVVELLRSKGVI